MHIKKLLAIMALTAPGPVAFHIHHVVPVFHINTLKKAKRKNLYCLFSLSARKRSGIQATKISGVSPPSGHAAINSNPEIILNEKDEIFFKKMRYVIMVRS